jgi:hypothetical protein
MSNWDQILDTVDKAQPETGHEMLVVSSADHPARVTALVQEWFGRDDSHTALRLVLDGKDRGILRRADAYKLAMSFDRGSLGGGDYASLPGYSVDYALLRLRCPTPGCDVTANAVSYDRDDPPLCSVHHVGLAVGG